MSLRELGQAAHYNYSRISRAERGQHLIDPVYLLAIDDALGTGGLLGMLRSLAPETTETIVSTSGMKTLPAGGLHVDDGDSVTLEMRTPDGRIVRVSLSRREFAQLLTTGMLRGLLPAGVADLDQAERVSKTLDEPCRIDPQVLDYFHTVLAEHFTADKMLGPRHLLGPVLAQIEILDRLRQHTRPGTAEPTLRLQAQYAEFAGWLHQDAGDTTAAMFWSDRATQWAQAAGDYQMVAYMLVRKSNIALLDDDAVNVVDLAAAARKVPGPVSPKLHALAAQQEARGWALVGEADQFRHGSTRPRVCCANTPTTSTRPPRSTCTTTTWTSSKNSPRPVTVPAEKADTAVVILERKIAATPEHLHRDLGHQQAKLANTVLATSQPDPERAVSLGLRCIGTARSTGSARITKELHTLDKSLTRRWPTLPGTAVFREALAAA